MDTATPGPAAHNILQAPPTQLISADRQHSSSTAILSSSSRASFHFANRPDSEQPAPLLVTVQKSTSLRHYGSESSAIRLEVHSEETNANANATSKTDSIVNTNNQQSSSPYAATEISRVHIAANPQFDFEFSDYVLHWHTQKEKEIEDEGRLEEQHEDEQGKSATEEKQIQDGDHHTIPIQSLEGSAKVDEKKVGAQTSSRKKDSVMARQLLRSSSPHKSKSKLNPASDGELNLESEAHHPLDLLFKSLPLHHREGKDQDKNEDVHSISNAEKIHELLSDVDISYGLNDTQVDERRTLYGWNKIEEEVESSWKVFAKKFWGLSAWMLEIVVIFALAIQNWINAVVVFALLFMNAILSFWKDMKGRKSVQQLKEQLKVESRVRRQNEWKKISAEEIVPGDIVRLRIGDIAPADCIVFQGQASADQSALTGETELKQLLIGDVVYSGSLLKNGEVSVIVVAIALNTYFGKSIKLVQSSAPAVHLNELLKQMMKSLLSLVILMLVLAVIVSAARHQSLLDIVPLLLMLLVSAIPVALPTMYTSAASYGSQQLSANGVLVSRLAACEDVARMTILCSDKTGTLTENKLALQDVSMQIGHYLEVLRRLYRFADPESNESGVMMVPPELVNSRSKLARRMAGSFIEVDKASVPEELHGLLQRFSKSDLLLLSRFASVDANHDPIDLAIIHAAQALQSVNGLPGFSAESLQIHENEFVVSEFFPFNPSTRRTEALVKGVTKPELMFKISKGAVETLLNECLQQILCDAEQIAVSTSNDDILNEVHAATNEFRALVNAEADRIASQGFRSISLTLTDGHGTHYWLGLLALFDPPRHDSADVVQQLNGLGIEVKMLTGDSWKVACNVAQAVGIGSRILNLEEEKKNVKLEILQEMNSDDKQQYLNQVKSGAKVAANEINWIARMDEKIFSKLSEKYDHFLPINGFANIYPEDKHRIVSILQQTASRTGEGKSVVGMTGDGVNDAPALKQADVGVAMNNATDIAKGAAAIVLLNEGLSSILPLVRVGREIHKRIVTWIINKIMKTLQVAVFVVFASVIYNFYPIASFHMVLLLLLVDFVTITLATDPQAISKSPSVWRMSSLTVVGVCMGLLGVLEAFLIFQLCRSQNFVSDYSYSDDSIQTIGFELVYFFSVISIFNVRETKRFFRTRPSLLLISIIFLQTIIVMVFCSTGIPTVLNSVPLADSIVLLGVLMAFCLLLNDSVKLIIFKWTKYTDE